MRFLLSWLALPALAAATLLPELAAAKPGFTAFYGQSEAFWEFHQDMARDRPADARSREMIRNLRNNYELAFGRANFHSDKMLAGAEDIVWPRRFHFTLEAEGAAQISAPGADSNEIRMSRLFGGVLKGSYQGNLAEDLYFEMGFAFGAGEEMKVRIAQTPSAVSWNRSRGVTLIGGLDLKLQKIWRLGITRLINTLQTEETYFKTINERYEGDVSWKLRSLSHDWQFRTDYMFYQMNLHGIVGVNPYPTLLLPRSWNRVVNVSSESRPLRSLAGFGGGFTFLLADGVQVAALGGYYAGGYGGEMRFRFAKTVTLKASGYLVNNSSDYQNFSQRVYAAGLDIDL